MEPSKSVSIFYPCYQDWGTMGSMVLLTVQTAERLGLDYDVTLIDDGSGEQTQDVLREIERRFPQVRVVHHDENLGYGGALRSGFAAATRDWIFYTDGDAQYDVREMDRLLEHAKPGVDVVQGYKITRHDPLHRIVIGRIYHWIVKTAFGLKLRDVDCDFRLIRRRVFDTVELVSDSGVICAEMMVKIQRAGFRVVEVPVHHYQRAHGKSQFFNFRRIARVGWQLSGLWLRLVFQPALSPRPRMIPFLELTNQFRAIEAEVRSAIDRVLARGWYVLGEECAAFESEFATWLSVEHAVGVNSGTDAIGLALRALGVGPGDEVITVANTCVPTAVGIVSTGATLVLADCDRRTRTIDIESVAAALTPRTRAIVPVHLYGHPCDMAPLMKLARDEGLAVVEDCAQAHGARYRGQVCGTFGDAAAFSFYPSKNLGAFGDGGAVVTRDPEVAERLRRLRHYGQADRYHHVDQGVNSRLDELQAAILRAKLPHLDAWNAARRERAHRYLDRLAHFDIQVPQIQWAEPCWHLFAMHSSERDHLREQLSARGIGTEIHYPIPLHLQPCYADLGYREGQFPEAERSCRLVVSLPLYPELPLESVDEVATAVERALR